MTDTNIKDNLFIEIEQLQIKNKELMLKNEELEREIERLQHEIEQMEHMPPLIRAYEYDLTVNKSEMAKSIAATLNTSMRISPSK